MDDESTGEYDVSELEAEEEDYDEETEVEEKSPVMRFIKTQLPFLAKLLPKKTAKKTIPKAFPVETPSSDETQELATSEGPRAKWEELLEKQVPFLYKFVVQIKSKIKKTPKAKASVETEGEAPKKKIKPIHIIIIGALIFLFYDELTKEPEPEVVEPVTETKVEKNEPSTAPTPPSEETAEPVEIAEPTETTEPVEVAEPVETTEPVETVEPVETTEPTETIEPVEIPDEPIIELPDVTEEPSPSTMDETTNEEDSSLIESEELDETDESSTEEDEASTITSPVIEEPLEPISPDIYNTEQDITSSILESLEEKVKEQKKIEIEETLEATEAPSYEYKGRALVYNCTGGHWACIDDESYKSCAKNFQWNKAQSKEIECYADEVYATEEDCSRAQILKIDNVAKTDFCNN